MTSCINTSWRFVIDQFYLAKMVIYNGCPEVASMVLDDPSSDSSAWPDYAYFRWETIPSLGAERGYTGLIGKVLSHPNFDPDACESREDCLSHAIEAGQLDVVRYAL
jgi:hypothetical protein